MKPDYEGPGVQLYLGDCLQVLPTLADGSVDAVITDPPFKLSQEYSAAVDADNLEAVSCIWAAAGDMLRVVRPGGPCAMFYDSRILPVGLAAMRRAGWKYLRHLVLYRRWGRASLVNGWMSTSDFILIFVRPGARHHFYGDVRHDVYVKDSPEREWSGHPAQKPMDVLCHIVGRVVPPGGILLDPFMGSGTTGHAALSTGRRFIGIEINPGYFGVARKRLSECDGPLFAPAQPSLFSAPTDAPPERRATR